MKFAVVLALALLSCAAATQKHPIANVIELLEGIAQKVTDEGKAEAVSFTKFEYWCKNSKKELNAAIADEEETISELSDTIDSKTKLSATLDKEIKALTTKIGKQVASQAEATRIRNEERGNFEDADRYFKSTITAIQGATTALEGAGETTESLAQVSKAVALLETRATTEQLDTLHAFVSGPSGSGSADAHVDKYKFKSGNIIELLKSLEAKFADDLLEATKAETNAANAYDLAKKSLDNAKKAAIKSKGEKITFKAEADRKNAAAKADKISTERDHTDDSKLLKDTTADCTTKTDEWNQRSSMREGELAAIDAACKILAKAGNVRTEMQTNKAQSDNPMGFLQISVSDPKMKAVQLIRESATKTHSKVLERFAQQLSVNLNGPFDAVNNMIEKMIFRLQAEQKDEDEHKLWCDQELEKTDAMITDKEANKLDLKLKIQAAKAKIQTLGDEITAADTMVSDIVAHVKESREIRAESKTENAISIKDAQEAQTAIANAVAVLTQFYKDSGRTPKEDWEFIQGPATLKSKPETWGDGSDYEGAGSQPDGILSVLTTTGADFAAMETNTAAQESSEQDAFETDMKDCAIEKAGRSKESEMKNEEKKRLQDKSDAMTKSKKNNQGELDATNQYLKDLQPACVGGDNGEKEGDRNAGGGYVARKQARTDEIGALRTAQGVLTDAFKESSASFLQKRH